MHDQRHDHDYDSDYYARIRANLTWWQRFGLMRNPSQGVVATVEPREGERILDLGCGDGRISSRLAQAGAAVDAWDISEDGIALARSSYPIPSLGFYVRDMLSLDVAETYDACLCQAVLEHLSREQVTAVLAHIKRALKPGGRVIVGIPLHDTRPERRWVRERLLGTIGDHTHLVEWSANRMLQEIRKVGLNLTSIKLTTFGGVLLPGWVRHLDFLEKMIGVWLTVRAAKPQAQLQTPLGGCPLRTIGSFDRNAIARERKGRPV